MIPLDEDLIYVPEVSIPGCKVYVPPTSYVLMEPEERERKWVDDVKNNRYPACLWIQVARRLADKRAANLDAAEASNPCDLADR